MHPLGGLRICRGLPELISAGRTDACSISVGSVALVRKRRVVAETVFIICGGCSQRINSHIAAEGVGLDPCGEGVGSQSVDVAFSILIQQIVGGTAVELICPADPPAGVPLGAGDGHVAVVVGEVVRYLAAVNVECPPGQQVRIEAAVNELHCRTGLHRLP